MTKQISLLFSASLFLWVFLSSGIEAANLSRLDSMRVSVMQKAHLPSTGTLQITTAMVDRLLNEYSLQLSHDAPAVYVDTSVILTANTHEYTLGRRFVSPGEANNKYKRIAPTGGASVVTGVASLKFITPEVFGTLEKSSPLLEKDITDASGPNFYFGQEYTLTVLPPPAFTDTIFLTYYTEANYMSSASDTTTLLPRYRLPLVWRVTADVAAVKGDMALSNYYMSLYQNFVGK